MKKTTPKREFRYERVKISDLSAADMAAAFDALLEHIGLDLYYDHHSEFLVLRDLNAQQVDWKEKLDEENGPIDDSDLECPPPRISKKRLKDPPDLNPEEFIRLNSIELDEAKWWPFGKRDEVWLTKEERIDLEEDRLTRNCIALIKARHARITRGINHDTLRDD